MDPNRRDTFGRNHCISQKNAKKDIFLIAVVILVLFFGVIAPVNAFNVATHGWIINKSIEYLKNNPNSVAAEYPLDSYKPYFDFAVHYADYSEVKCTWDWGSGSKKDSCDTIHHYGRPNTDINLYRYGGFPPVFTDGLTIANPGEYTAPSYSQVLYKQAVDFFPGGDIPSLSNLPLTDAGWVQAKYIIGDGLDLGTTYVGGIPMCDYYVSYSLDSPLIPTDACPRWPVWASTDTAGKATEESVANAMTYLGWSIHLVEDMSVPDHALNSVSDLHASGEQDIQDWIDAGDFDHLSGNSGEQYHFLPCGPCNHGVFSYPVTPEYFGSTQWSVQDFADEASTKSSSAYMGNSIQPSLSAYLDKYGNEALVSTESIGEHDVDTSIKIVSAVMEKYFREITPPPDVFEPNNVYSVAREVGPGDYPGLTLSTPKDEDWYKIHISEDYSDLIIEINYNRVTGTLAGEAERVNGDKYYPEATTDGIKFSMKNSRAGDYLIHLYPYDMPVRYEMKVAVSPGSLPPDYCEENDDAAHAREWSGGGCGCTITNDLNIDKPGDDDYFSVINVNQQEKFDVSIDYNPTAGDLQLYLDDQPGQLTEIGPTENKIEISKCGSASPMMIKVTGDRNYYTMCWCGKNDESCGYVPPQPGQMKLNVESTIPLDYVHVLAFPDDHYFANLYKPPDTDGNGGGNIPVGQSSFTLEPALSVGVSESDYILIGKSNDNLAVSMENPPASGDFDTLFPEFNSAGGEDGLVAALPNDQTLLNLKTPCGFMPYCPSLFSTAGTPDGLLLTPEGKTATIYSFSSGIPIGTVTFTKMTVPENSAPKLTVDKNPLIVNEGSTATNTGSWSDSDIGDIVTLTASIGDIIRGSDGTWSWSYLITAGAVQGQTVTITADDGKGGITTTSFDLTVNHNPKLVSPGDQTVLEGKTLTLNLVASDPDNDPLTYSFKSGTPMTGATLTDNKFAWIPPPGSAGTYHVTFKATDPGSLSDEKTITITVSAPVKVTILPNPLNIANKRGYFIAFVTLTKPYKAADVDTASVSCNGAPALKLIRAKVFPQIFAAIFSRDKLVGVTPGSNIKFTVTGKINKNGQKVGFTGTNMVTVINKALKTKEVTDDAMKMSDDKIFTFNPR